MELYSAKQKCNQVTIDASCGTHNVFIHFCVLNNMLNWFGNLVSNAIFWFRLPPNKLTVDMRDYNNFDIKPKHEASHKVIILNNIERSVGLLGHKSKAKPAVQNWGLRGRLLQWVRTYFLCGTGRSTETLSLGKTTESKKLKLAFFPAEYDFPLFSGVSMNGEKKKINKK